MCTKQLFRRRANYVHADNELKNAILWMIKLPKTSIDVMFVVQSTTFRTENIIILDKGWLFCRNNLKMYWESKQKSIHDKMEKVGLEAAEPKKNKTIKKSIKKNKEKRTNKNK